MAKAQREGEGKLEGISNVIVSAFKETNTQVLVYIATQDGEHIKITTDTSPMHHSWAEELTPSQYLQETQSEMINPDKIVHIYHKERNRLT